MDRASITGDSSDNGELALAVPIGGDVRVTAYALGLEASTDIDVRVNVLDPNRVIGSPYFQSISLGFECAFFLAGHIGNRNLSVEETVGRIPTIETEGLRGGVVYHDGQFDDAPDERVVWGRLDNGLRYALQPHSGMPGRVSMRLVVLTGSMDETEDELGIAHFTEHMCFRGTRDFRYEEMNGFFHKLGMEYGSDVNAVTTFDHTSSITGVLASFQSSGNPPLFQIKPRGSADITAL